MLILDTISEAMAGTGPKTNDTKYQNALSELLLYDIGRSAYFDVMITGNSIGSALFNDDSRSLSYLCHSAELPGESIATVNQKIYGVTEKFPVMAHYNDITLSFYTRGSKVEIVRNTFLSWMTYLSGRDEVMHTGNTTYNVRYKDTYVADILITQYTISGEKQIQVKLKNAFPISINQIPLSWSAQNQAQSFNVTFAYTEYEYTFLSPDNNGNYSRGPLGELLGAGIKAAATINSIKGAIESGNPLAAIGAGLGLTNFTLSSGLSKIGL